MTDFAYMNWKKEWNGYEAPTAFIERMIGNPEKIMFANCMGTIICTEEDVYAIVKQLRESATKLEEFARPKDKKK